MSSWWPWSNSGEPQQVPQIQDLEESQRVNPSCFPSISKSVGAAAPAAISIADAEVPALASRRRKSSRSAAQHSIDDSKSSGAMSYFEVLWDWASGKEAERLRQLEEQKIAAENEFRRTEFKRKLSKLKLLTIFLVAFILLGTFGLAIWISLFRNQPKHGSAAVVSQMASSVLTLVYNSDSDQITSQSQNMLSNVFQGYSSVKSMEVDKAYYAAVTANISYDASSFEVQTSVDSPFTLLKELALAGDSRLTYIGLVEVRSSSASVTVCYSCTGVAPTQAPSADNAPTSSPTAQQPITTTPTEAPTNAAMPTAAPTTAAVPTDSPTQAPTDAITIAPSVM
eukprot:TRINITY_DN4148_c0_g1_i1.p1 TRINITY_DN4148_c0_g1~~TRINITY_DN4148_c0_g1_i1.p1  ORF type:complete len:339 (-),score=62.55 TRINITY_DN4148_c0_g1_i1:159-1175(-)